jgi:hypothetical protein
MTGHSATCVHCVVTRAATRLGRRSAQPITVCPCAARSALVAMEAPDVYALVSPFLRAAAADEHGGVRVRILAEGRAEIQILAVTGAARTARVRTLTVPRHAEDSLMGGFPEGHLA